MSLSALGGLPDASVDLAVMISVAQYMSPDELGGALALMRPRAETRWTPGARRHSQAEYRRADRRDGAVAIRCDEWILSGCRDRSRPYRLSDYWQLRQRIGLQRYGETEMIGKLALRRIDRHPRTRKCRTQSRTNDLYCPRAVKGTCDIPEIRGTVLLSVNVKSAVLWQALMSQGSLILARWRKRRRESCAKLFIPGSNPGRASNPSSCEAWRISPGFRRKCRLITALKVFRCCGIWSKDTARAWSSQAPGFRDARLRALFLCPNSRTSCPVRLNAKTH